MPKIEKEKKVYIPWTNTDLTEGKGYAVPICVCELEPTAERIGKGKSVMGSDAHVTEENAYYIDGKWYAPVQIVFPKDEDKEIDEKRKRRQEAIEKAKAAGLTEDDIKALVGVKL